MNRTQHRPLPLKQITVRQAVVFCAVLGALGLWALFSVNWRVGALSFLSWFLYVGVYTPLKQKSPIAVWVGAIPGAIPYCLGWLAYSNEVDNATRLLFTTQFFWQFPHFWAIAWVLDDDYALANFRLLPSKEGRDKNSALQTIIHTLMLIPCIGLMFVASDWHWATYLVFSALLGCNLYFLYLSVKLYQDLSIPTAKRLMFYSFIYLPVVQLLLLLASYFRLIDLTAL